MAIALIKNTVILIDNYTFGKYPKLERYFTLYDPITHEYHFMGMEYDEENHLLRLPRAIDLNVIKRNCPDVTIKFDSSSSPYEKIPKVKLKYLPRDEVQKEAIKFTLGMGNYYNNLNSSQININLRTGKGKTYVAVACMAYWSVKGIIIASNTEWLEQWKSCIAEYTNIDEREILIIKGSIDIQKIFKEYINLKRYKYFMVTHQTLASFGTKHGWDKVSELFDKLKVYVKIFDEAHLNFKNISNIDFHTNTKKTLYLTATPARSDKNEDFIYNIYFKTVPAIDLFDAEVDPHTKYVAIRFASMPTPQEKSKCYSGIYGLNRLGYIDYIVHNQNFYKLMYIVMQKVLMTNGKCLFYIGTNNAIGIVADWIEENYPELKGQVGIFTSVVDSKYRKTQLDKRLILTTTKSAGAAVDIKGLKASFVIAEPFKSKVLAAQTLGRTRDDNTTYFEIVDDSFRQISRYYLAKKPIFNRNATECIEIRANHSDLVTKAEELAIIRDNVKAQYEARCAVIKYTSDFDINSIKRND